MSFNPNGRSELTSQLVLRGFENTRQYLIINNGSTASFQSGAVDDNDDCSNLGLNISVPFNVTTNCVMVLIPFEGPCFGLRWRGSTTTQIHVTVDEADPQILDCANKYLVINNRNIGSQTMFRLTHTDLDPNIQHVARLHVPSQPVTGTAAVLMHGWVVSALAGIRPRSLSYQPEAAAAKLTTSLAAITQGAVSTGIDKVYYANTDSVARFVSIAYGSDVLKTIYLAASGTAGDSGEWSPTKSGIGNPGGAASNWQHKADAAAVVNFMVVGGK